MWTTRQAGPCEAAKATWPKQITPACANLCKTVQVGSKNDAIFKWMCSLRATNKEIAPRNVSARCLYIQQCKQSLIPFIKRPRIRQFCPRASGGFSVQKRFKKHGGHFWQSCLWKSGGRGLFSKIIQLTRWLAMHSTARHFKISAINSWTVGWGLGRMCSLGEDSSAWQNIQVKFCLSFSKWRSNGPFLRGQMLTGCVCVGSGTLNIQSKYGLIAGPYCYSTVRQSR